MLGNNIAKLGDLKRTYCSLLGFWRSIFPTAWDISTEYLSFCLVLCGLYVYIDHKQQAAVSTEYRDSLMGRSGCPTLIKLLQSFRSF